LQKSKNKEIYMRFLLSALPILVIPVMLLFGAYFRNQTLYKQEIYNKNLSILENSARMVESMLASVESIINYLNESSSVNKFFNFYSLNEDGKNTNEVLLLQKDICSLAAANDTIEGIQIFSKKNDMLLDSSSIVINLNRYYDYLFSIKDMSFDEWHENLLMKQHNWNSRFQSLEIRYGGSSAKVLLSSSDIPMNSGSYSTGSVFIMLDQNKLFQYFDRLEYRQDGFVYIQDENGNLLCEDNPTGNPDIYLSSEELVGGSGFLTRNIAGRQLFLTYYKDKNGWIYVSAIPKDLAVGPVHDNWMYFLTMLCFALGIGAVLIYYFTTRLSAPLTKIGNILCSGNGTISYHEFDEAIETLIKKNEQMQIELEKQIPALKTSIFHTLVTGGYRTREEITDNLNKLQIDPRSSLYLIIIVSLNDLNMESQLENIAAQKIFLKDIIGKSFFTTHIYDLDFERIGILLTSDIHEKQEAKKECEQKLFLIKEKVEGQSGISISFHGEVVNDIAKLPSGFKHVRTSIENECESFGRIIQWYDEKNYVKNIRQQETYDINQRIRMHIEENYADPQLSLSSVADCFGISEVYLSRLFKQAFEQNFSKYVEELRMQKAKELMDSGDYTVSKTAETVGYNSPQTFRRAYKRVYGCTPREH
jgi:AraC-like DNA-binding protein